MEKIAGTDKLMSDNNLLLQQFVFYQHHFLYNLALSFEKCKNSFK